MSLSGKIALVTGAAQGLGKAFSRALLERGAKVGLADVNEDQGQATLAEFSAEFGQDKVMFVKCDVSDGDQMKKTFTTIHEQLGGLDVVINNAGMGNEFERWEKTVDVNLKGTIRGTTLALDLMRRDKGGNGGVIVNISSMAAINPTPCGPVYSATKGGINMMSLSYAANPEVAANGVRINVLCPSFADTALVDMLTDPTKIHAPQLAQKIKETVGIMTLDYVASNMMELIEDTTKHGAVMMLAKGTGKQYYKQ